MNDGQNYNRDQEFGVHKNVIPQDATIADVLRLLGDPEEYVRQVLSTFYTMKKQGEVVVRIGTTGTGLRPSYRIDMASTGEPISAFDGQTHRAFTDVKSIDTENWSSCSMNFVEVRDLLGQIRSRL
ncbi:hypothetical protein [Microvirga yunnanensis]|uniref:hypothetical protein n=1 Tax=Microvirga yunnanensis TaxID=2953740 RepID=UPI0021C5F4C8|nr:hypothetical protein [Microvirga sp. HBU65207]